MKVTDRKWRVEARHALRFTTLSTQQIAIQLGVSSNSIKKLLTHEAIEREEKRQKPGPKRFSNQKPLSADHLKIGLGLTHMRAGRKKAEMASELGGSAARLGKMEAGLHDFTLTELQKISEALGRPLYRLDVPTAISLRAATIH